jgi:hypothetical protein
MRAQVPAGRQPRCDRQHEKCAGAAAAPCSGTANCASKAPGAEQNIQGREFCHSTGCPAPQSGLPTYRRRLDRRSGSPQWCSALRGCGPTEWTRTRYKTTPNRRRKPSSTRWSGGRTRRSRWSPRTDSLECHARAVPRREGSTNRGNIMHTMTWEQRQRGRSGTRGCGCGEQTPGWSRVPHSTVPSRTGCLQCQAQGTSTASAIGRGP